MDFIGKTEVVPQERKAGIKLRDLIQVLGLLEDSLSPIRNLF